MGIKILVGLWGASVGFCSQILASTGQQELGNAALEAFLQHKEEIPCESGAAAFLPISM